MEEEADTEKPGHMWCTCMWCDCLLVCIKGTRMLLLFVLLVAVVGIQFKEDKISLWLTFYWIALSENNLPNTEEGGLWHDSK